MDFHQQSNICIKHTQPILIVNKDGHFCVACLLQLPGNISIEQFNQQQQIIGEVTKQIDLDHKSFQELLDQLLKFKDAIILSLDKISQYIQDQIKSIKESKSKIDTMKYSNKKSIIDELETESNKQYEFNKEAKNQMRKQLQSFQLQIAEISQLYPFLEDKSIVAQQQVGEQKLRKIQDKECQVDNVKQKFSYELIKESTLKLENNCSSFAFNKDNTILVIGSNKEIIVYEFMNGRISKEWQRLNNNYVNCLYFMKQSNSFVSGNSNNSIIIWVLDNDNKWIPQQVLKEYNSSILCILMNKMEDQLISGSLHCTLMIWRNKTGSWQKQQSFQTKFQILNLSLNEKEDKLIVCQNNWERNQKTKNMSCIDVFLYENNEKWCRMQTIDIPEHGYRLSFTNGDQFLFTVENSDYLQVYEYNTEKMQFLVVSQIKIQNVKECCGYFPCQFIKSQNILTYKHGQFINIIKMNQKQNYELIQTIGFDDFYSKGRLTDDGQYLVTWDNKSKEISILIIKQQE